MKLKRKRFLKGGENREICTQKRERDKRVNVVNMGYSFFGALSYVK